MPEDLIASAPARSRRLFYAAAFFTFSSLGFIVDVMRPAVRDPLAVMALAGGTGLMAIAFVYVATYYRRWFGLFAAVALALMLVTVVLVDDDGVPLADAAPTALRLKFLIDGVGCLVGFTLSYSFFMGFIGEEGTRHARVRAEIELAREIHQHLVPALESRNGRLDVFGLSVPSAEIGGDLVDLATLGDGRIGYVADVSGHGVGSGLLMGIVKSAVRTRLLAGGTLPHVLNDLNRVLVPLSKPNMFVTFAALQCDAAGRLTFSVCGHPPILHYRAATATIDELSLPQVPLGMFEDRAFSSADIAGDAGDLFLVLTDGLIEVFDADDEEYGLERVKAVVRECAGQPLRAIAAELLRRTRQHGPQIDDQTMLLLRVHAEVDG